MNNLCLILFVLAGIAFALKRGLRYLQYLQQDEYSNSRFLRWFWLNKAFDSKGSGLLFLCIGLNYCLEGTPKLPSVSLLVAAIIIAAIAFIERDPRKEGKLKLNFTERAQRIFIVYSGIFLFLNLTCLSILSLNENVIKVFFAELLFFQLLPLLILLSNTLLSPLQKSINVSFMKDARRILKENDPYVIGITGSYGKTSVKHALGELLNATLAPTFFTPKSINTVLGITREIRENLKPFHQYAIMEMGAYREDSIKKLCEFTPPRAGIITAIGLSHLERFKTEDAVYRAKSELAKAVPECGILVCNGDNPGARKIASEFKKKTTLLYGFEKNAGALDCVASSLNFSDKGSSFTIHWEGSAYNIKTKLLGRPIISNVLAAFTMSCALGADPTLVAAAISNLEPVDNRLKLVKSAGLTYLQDAYNSNPTGFGAALEVLAGLSGNQKILMTPGMVELGDKQYSENEQVAEMASRICSKIVVVGETNKKAFSSGLQKGGVNGENVLFAKNREEAFSMLYSLQKEGDIILIENDLPDLYEGKERF